MDAATQAAVWGFLGTILTVTGVVVAAILTNRTEKGKAAKSAMENTLRERIVLRDEQIAHKDKRIKRLEEQIKKLEQEKDCYRLAIDEARAEETARLKDADD